jgi:formylglycine-generating enzyme required for sulfatase activity
MEIYLRMRDEYLSQLGNPEIPKLMRLFNTNINRIKECKEIIKEKFYNKFVVVDCDYVWLGTNQNEIDKLLESSAITMSPKYIQIEYPKHKVKIRPFKIAKFAVTNKEYSLFDENHFYPNEEEYYPATDITWNNALKFAKWWGARLPTEAEWVAAARGNTNYIYTWGNKFDKVLCNCEDTGIRHKLPVDSFSEGVSQFGCFNMIGNCWEMTNSLLRDFPYNSNDGRENPNVNNKRVIKGGSYSTTVLMNLRIDSRDCKSMETSNSRIGFRLAI